MIPTRHFVVALKRQAEIEGYISQELSIPIEFCDLSNPNLDFEAVECIWVDMTTRIDSSLLSRFTNLKYLASPTTGLTHLHLSNSQMKNLQVISLKGESEFLKEITSTAELAWGLALMVWRRIAQASLRYSDDVSVRSEFAGLQLKHLSVGLIGFGRLGRMLSSYARGFDMRTLYFDPYIENPELGKSDSVYECKSLEELCRLSDIIFLVASHESQRAAQYPILDRKNLQLLKRHSVVVNVSRGSLLDEDALADLIEAGDIFGAGIDVLAKEETNGKGISRLQSLQSSGFNVVVTPHIGGMCSDAFEKAQRFTARRLRDAISKTGSHIVDQ